MKNYNKIYINKEKRKERDEYNYLFKKLTARISVQLYQSFNPKKDDKDIFGNPITIANPSFIPYLNDYFEIITDDNECTLFDKYVSSSPFSSIFFKNTDTNYGYVSDFFATTYTSVLKNGTIEPPFALKQKRK